MSMNQISTLADQIIYLFNWHKHNGFRIICYFLLFFYKCTQKNRLIPVLAKTKFRHEDIEDRAVWFSHVQFYHMKMQTCPSQISWMTLHDDITFLIISSTRNILLDVPINIEKIQQEYTIFFDNWQMEW